MKTRGWLLLTAAAALLAVKARTAATSRVELGGTYAADFGGKIPVPDEYRAAARRALDEAGSPESILLYAAGTDESAWKRSARLDDGSVLVEVLPLENAESARARARTLPAGDSMRRLEGLAYPAFAVSLPGRVSVQLITPKRLVRISSARWTTAFDAVVRGYRDDA